MLRVRKMQYALEQQGQCWADTLHCHDVVGFRASHINGFFCHDLRSDIGKSPLVPPCIFIYRMKSVHYGVSSAVCPLVDYSSNMRSTCVVHSGYVKSYTRHASGCLPEKQVYLWFKETCSPPCFEISLSALCA